MYMICKFYFSDICFSHLSGRQHLTTLPLKKTSEDLVQIKEKWIMNSRMEDIKIKMDRIRNKGEFKFE